MSTYTVTRLIKSALNLGGPCEIDGIQFKPIEPFRAKEGLLLEKVLFDCVACGRTADYVGGLGVRAGR